MAVFFVVVHLVLRQSCCAATKKRSQGLRLDPYVSHSGGSIVVLPAANLRGPPEKYSMRTFTSVCMLLLYTLGLFLFSGTLRVSQAAKAMMAARGGRFHLCVLGEELWDE